HSFSSARKTRPLYALLGLHIVAKLRSKYRESWLAPKPSGWAMFDQPSGGCIEPRHSTAQGIREPLVCGERNHSRATVGRNRSNSLPEGSHISPIDRSGGVIQKQDCRVECERAAEPDTDTGSCVEMRDWSAPRQLGDADFAGQVGGSTRYVSG